jgi:hypothetical protein
MLVKLAADGGQSGRDASTWAATRIVAGSETIAIF